MKQIVPFTKDIKLNNNVEEIVSISLEHELRNIIDNEISGVFNLYFEYKENDISINVLKYEDKIPFNVDIDDRYQIDNANVDIDDFYYEIEDDRVVLHIDLLVNDIELKEEEIKEIIPIHSEISKEEMITNNEDVREEFEIEDLFSEVETDVPLEIPKKNSKPIFKTFDPQNETYVTYNVHIVRDMDNIDSICELYKVTKEELSYYNDIKEIKFGDKLIVPTYKK